MSWWKRTAPIAVALFLSLGITAAFAMGVFSGDGSEESVDIEQDENRTPAPTVDVEQDETLPNNETRISEQSNRGDGFGFENVATDDGFEYESRFRGRGLISQSGVYAVDYNNDGYEDLLATGGEQPVLFENVGGTFERARSFDHPDTRAAHFFDYDNDGWRDLILAEYAGQTIFYENLNGTFTQRDIGLERAVSSPTSITSADFTGNGIRSRLIPRYPDQPSQDAVRWSG